MARKILKVEFSLADFKIKKKRETILDDIKNKICALLNTNGGRLVLIASDPTASNNIHTDGIINPIEQWLVQFVGLSKTDANFKCETDNNTITVEIAGLPTLCTLNTNLFLPTQSSISMLHEPDRIREILFERRVVEFPQQIVREQFYQGCDSRLRESSSVQLKNLNPEKTKSTNLADRIIKHKLMSWVSGFANHSGGQIFYGIEDHGIVVGESLRDEEEIERIKTKVGNAIQKMIWPEELGKIQCEKQWDIKFVPVMNCDTGGETLPLTFVIVISVLPCPGGVFVTEPESYHVVDGEVKKISFDTWKEKVKTGNSGLKRKDEVPMEMKRKEWRSAKSEKAYMNVTQELVKRRQLGEWQGIKNICKVLCERENQHINTKRVALFHLIAVEYRLGDSENAVKHLEEFRNGISTNGDEDKSITCVEERYSTSAIERSSGNYQDAWKIIEEGLQHCFDVPAGLIPAAFYANAALVLSKLVDNESFIGVSRKDECFKDKVQENVKRVEYFCDLALQHVQCVKNDFEIAKEELKQRINIALASLYLKSESTNDSQVSLSDIDKATKKIREAENSLKQLKGTAYLKFNYCRILLAKCDLRLRKYQLKGTDIDNELKTKFLKHLKKAQKIAENNGFKEIMRGCKYREDWERSLKQVNDNEKEMDESKSDEMLVSELLGYNDEKNPQT